MDNNLNYSVAERKDPRNPEQEGLYYAHVRSKGVVDTKELIDRIRNRGTVGSPDIVAVLITMEEIVTDALCNGEIVRQQTYHEGEGYIQGGKDSEVRNGYGAFQEGGIRGIPPCSGKKCRAWGDFVFLCN